MFSFLYQTDWAQLFFIERQTFLTLEKFSHIVDVVFRYAGSDFTRASIRLIVLHLLQLINFTSQKWEALVRATLLR